MTIEVTLQQLENVANAAMEFRMDVGTVHDQSKQKKPLLREMEKRQKTYPGGKGLTMEVRVKGVYTSTIQGYGYDDEVDYSNPGNIRKANYQGKEIHIGIGCTLTELLEDGVSVVDSLSSEDVRKHADRAKTVLANIFDDKLDDMTEGRDIGMNDMYWDDGTQDAKLIPGIRSFIVDDPTSAAIVGGIDQQANSWWRNRANLSIDVSDPLQDQPLLAFWGPEFRQLTKRGKGHKHKAFCGNDFLTRMENELRANGSYTQTGWQGKENEDFAIRGVVHDGVVFEWDPTLDDMNLSDYCFVIDFNVIHPMVIEGQNWKKHAPARPENKYVMYRAATYAGGLVCKQRNTSGVYALA